MDKTQPDGDAALTREIRETHGARIGVAGQALDVFERHTLLQQVSDGGDSEGVYF